MPQQTPFDAVDNRKIVPAVLVEPDAARYIGRSRSYMKKGRLLGYGPAYVRVGRSITYRLGDLDDWLASHVVRTGISR